jgi:hypothetical protein
MAIKILIKRESQWNPGFRIIRKGPTEYEHYFVGLYPY